MVDKVKLDERKELIRDFVEEAQEFLDELEALLMQLEQGVGDFPDPDLLKDILGHIHTFKGNSGMMGYSGLQRYSHRIEDLFKGLQSGEFELNVEFIDFSMQCVSIIRNAVSGVSIDDNLNPLMEEGLEGMEKFLDQKNHRSSGTKTVNVSSNLELFNPFAKKTNLLKVDFEKMDHLLNLMGELIIQRTRLGQIDAHFREELGEKGIAAELSNASEQISKIATELHEAIMKVRMIPIKQVFMRFPRYVRDFARERGKEISLYFEGEETELDKTIIDEIGEPLIHLIRNAIDHGIEDPQERKASGKPQQGTIRLQAYQESSHIIISVEDDGKGIDEEVLRKKANEEGLLKNNEIENQDLINLIFVSGFSTADHVTEISGRGVGMDVIKKSLARINGSIDVESKINTGTIFTIKLPLTLAIITVLMVGVSGEQYAIPLTSVLESIRVKNEDIHFVNNREITNIRGRILPVGRLSNLFGLSQINEGNGQYVVVVQSGNNEIGIVVDSLIGQQEIVIKALDDYIGNSSGISGATILGNGRVVLIVDIPDLMEKVSQQGWYEKKPEVEHA